MADITYTNVATNRSAAVDAVIGKGDSGNLKKLLTRTIELAASASGVTVNFGSIASNARISSISRVYWDDLATSGSPTLDIGLGSVDSNITSDPDALSNGHALTTATNAGASVITDPANAGLPAWDFVSGQTTDPKGQLDVYGTIKDAATTQTGTITVELFGYLD